MLKEVRRLRRRKVEEHIVKEIQGRRLRRRKVEGHIIEGHIVEEI